MITTLVALILAGAVLLFLEVFLPGMIAGIAGAVCLVAAVVYAYQHFPAETGHWVLFGIVIGSAVGTAAWFKFFPDSRIARRFTLEQTGGGSGVERPELLGKNGEADTPLRPAGTAVIMGHRVDVVSDGAFIEKGARVRVTAVEGTRVVVTRE